MTYIGKFGTIRLEMELTMRLTLVEPGAKSLFKIFFSLLSYKPTISASDLVDFIH
jgi:hypothetical protein